MSIRTYLALGIVVVASTARLFAGGSGLNVVVVVNAASTNSLQLGNYYCEKRQVPPQNVLRINWTGSIIEWANAGGDFPGTLFNPLMTMLAERSLTNQIDYVVLSMDIPYRIFAGFDYYNSTTAALSYGFKPYPDNPAQFCTIATNSASAYAGSEGIFRDTPPISVSSNSFLVTMITSSNLALAKQIVDSGVFSDSTFPTQTIYLIKTADVRSVRFVLFDNAIFNTRVLAKSTMARTNSNSATNLGGILGLEFGLQSFSLDGTTFAPGAMADNLTSFGGFIFDPAGGQTLLLDMLRAGAAGSYGTVIEPCAYISKFPSPQNYFYQARGFSLAECYYQSVTNPYEGLIVGEPLAAPFAQPASGDWDNLSTNTMLSGTTNLALHFTASDVRHPVQQVDLFLNGLFYQTMTNIPPGMSNVLYVTINGFRTNYTVPTNATIKSVTSNLTSRLNTAAYKKSSKVAPYTYGDRIELQSTNVNTLGSQISVSTSNYIGSSPVLTTFVCASRSNCLDSIAWGVQGYHIGTGVTNGDVLTLTVTKTNGANVTVSVTNTTGLTDLGQFIQQFMNAINAKASLQGSDGLTAEDLTQPYVNFMHINLRARGQGLLAAQIQVQLTSADFAYFLDDLTSPSGAQKLNGNLEDLQPRNHLYVTAGLTNLPVQFPFDTTAIADGWHELSAVAYEGSHVRTQTRISQTVLVQNTSLSAVFNCLACDVNVGLDGTLQFSVVANTNTITQIELFSTGGSWGVVTNQSSAAFSIAAASLQLGLHPFYSIVTRDDGKQYRTETRWIRIQSSFALNIDGNGPTLSWLAQTGGLYEVLSAMDVTGTFQLRDSLTATNPTAQWLETNDSVPQQFYRVRMLP